MIYFLNTSKYFRKKYFILFFLFSVYTISSAQAYLDKLNRDIDSLQIVNYDFVKKNNFNTAVEDNLEQYLMWNMDDIQNKIRFSKTIPIDLKINILSSLKKYLLHDKTEFTKNQITEFRFMVGLNMYEQMINRILDGKEIDDIFEGYPELVDLIAGFFEPVPINKKIIQLKTYHNIIAFDNSLIDNLKTFGKNNDFYYKDKLIDYIIYNKTELLANAMVHDPEVKGIIANSKNPYALTLVELVNKPNFESVLPFIEDYKTNPNIYNDIIALRDNKVTYFQKLVDQNIKASQSQSKFINYLQDYTKQSAYLGFIYPINENHNLPNEKRFAPIKNLRPEDYYFLITIGAENVYTSSFLGLYNELSNTFTTTPASDLLQKVNRYSSSDFVRTLSDYGKLSDFFSHVNEEQDNLILDEFIKPYNIPTKEIVPDAMELADVMYNISQDPVLKEKVSQKIDVVINEAKHNKDFRNEFFFTNFKNILNYQHLPEAQETAVLPYNKLANSNGNVVAKMFFYGDDDGKSSYANFIGTMTSSGWKKTLDTKYFVELDNIKNPKVKIFANKPLDTDEGYDIIAQDSMVAHLKKKNEAATILIHRGHSYFLYNTILKQTGEEVLTILGSCGGYDFLTDIFRNNPNTHIVATRQIGSKFVNDPMLDEIYKKILASQDIKWEEIWGNLSVRLKNNKAATELLAEYVPPNRNLGLLYLKLVTKSH